ncbi:GxxExxY protein [Verrucomicrobia bacterium LW23]|nr:GxxExxY protein [Verrucomicrobia bacterium LW23]
MTEDEIGAIIVQAAYDIHCDLGPGMLESVYEVVLAGMLREKGLRVDRQYAIPIVYKGTKFDEGFRADLFVESKVIIKVEAVQVLANAHRKQLLTYLKLAGIRLGYLSNFWGDRIKGNIERTANGLNESGRNSPL